MKKRSESFFGLHFDYHAQPKYGVQGINLKEEDIREICRLVKPDFIQIDCKGHPGWASYPSKIGNAMPEFAQDTLALWRKVTREEDVALYMHYSGVYDKKYCAEHPEDTVVNANGSRVADTTRTMGEYVNKLLIPQLTELAEKYEVDGFWIDGECWKTRIDYHPDTVAAFENETGINLNGALPVKEGDPYYIEYREYNRELFRRYVRHYVDTLHKKFPNLQIASNWAFSDHMPEKVSVNVDYLSGDLDPKNSFHSARYAARALAQQNAPWDLMSWNFRREIAQFSAVVAKHPRQLMQEAAAVISLGGAFQNYIMQYFDGSPNVTDVRNLVELSEFIQARKAFCFRGKPIHQAAVLLSTYDRYREATLLFSRTGYERTMGATTLLCDAGQSVEIVSEHMLEQNINEFKMIVIPELSHGLAPETITSLLEYAQNGGRLVLLGSKTCEIFAENDAPFKTEKIKEFFDFGQAAYDNGGETGHTTSVALRHKPYYFTADEKTFGVAFSPCKIIAENKKCEAYVSEALLGERDCLAATIDFGKGSVTAIGFDIGKQYLTATQYHQRALMKQTVDSLYVPMVRIESAYGLLEVVALNKDGKTMIQLISGGGTHANPACATNDYIPPVVDIELSIELSSAPQKLIYQPEGKELSFEYKNGRVYVKLDRVDIHGVIEVCE